MSITTRRLAALGILMRSLPLALVVLLASAAAAADPPAIDVIVHPSSKVTAIDASELEEIYRGVRTLWGGGESIIAINLPAQSATRVAFDRVVLHMSPSEVGRYWVDQRIRGGRRSPRQVSDPLLVARLVARLPGSIGYVPAGTPLENVRVVARIRQEQVREPQ